MTAPDLVERYTLWQRAESRSDRTINDRRDILTRLDRELPYGIDFTSEDDLKAWLWRDGWSMGTRETYHGAMSDFFRWATDIAEEIEFNPAAGISRPKPAQRLPNPVTDEELRRALSEAREPYLTFVLLGVYAGLRCLDISNMRRERVTEQAVSVLASKGGAARVVPTHPIVWDAVKDLPPGPITAMTARQISIYSCAYLQRTLGLAGVRPHRFRHWFGTQVQRHYKDLRVTQELLGHKDPRTTAGYALVAAQQTRAAIDLLPTFGDVRPGAATTV